GAVTASRGDRQDELVALALQADGRAVAAGFSGGDLALARYGLAEGETATLAGSIADPGLLDGHTLVINWGDGLPPETFPLAPGAAGFSPTHGYADDGPHAVTA